MSPCVSLSRAWAIHKRYRQTGNCAFSPSSLLLCKCCAAASRSPVQDTAHQFPVQVSGIGMNWLALVHHKLQKLLECADCLVETTQCQPDIGQNKGCADCVRDVAGCPQFHGVIGKDPVGGFQVPTCPVGNPQEHGCLSAPEMVSFRHELEYPPGVPDRVWNIAECLGI